MSPVAKYWNGTAWTSLGGLPVYEQPDAPAEPVPVGSVWVDTDAPTLALPPVVRGEVTSAGSVSRGSGFTVVRVSPGRYDVTFSSAFRVAPIVVATTAIGAINLVAISLAGFTVQVFGTTTGNNLDGGFNFVAVES